MREVINVLQNSYTKTVYACESSQVVLHASV